jgi:ribonucleoside-triphosphate reductase (thioredoxin)
MSSDSNIDKVALAVIQVCKRDGSLHTYTPAKITGAVRKAFQSSGESMPEKLNASIERSLLDFMGRASSPLNISDIQDVIERVLMERGCYETAKRYILYRHQRDSHRSARSALDKIVEQYGNVEVPWGPVGYVTYKRTYSRPLEAEDGTSEEFSDTICRVLTACQTQLGIGFTNEELKVAYRAMMSLKFSVAGRFLWQLGTTTVDRLGLASLQNCAFVKIDAPIRPFLWIFDMLMLGVGVGFSVERNNVDKLPPVLASVHTIRIVRKDTNDADFIVPDSREGWVSLMEKVLEAFFITGRSFSFSTILVRSAGSPIQGFGGVASGPGDLCVGIDNIRKVLAARRGQKLRPIDCLDVANIIAAVVVAGNIRRSAMICIGDCDDIEYLRAKRWDLGNVPNWRAMSNNSIACEDIGALPEEFWEGYKGNGEPYGLINLPLARSIGRTQDGGKYPDPDVDGFNPCAEQGLANHETCCLSELFLPNLDSFEEAFQVAKMAYRICKHSLMLPCHHGETEAIVRKNSRMGIGITGYMQASAEQRAFLAPLYERLREYDVEYSRRHGCPTSVKLTTVKPSGTLSLLAGVTPGAHPGIYPYFIRRIRIAAGAPIAELCKEHGFPCEPQIGYDGTEDRKTLVVSFPCSYPAGTTLAKDMTAIDQLETVKRLQHDWSDNAVSVTVYYRKEELPAIREWLACNYKDNLKTCSFLLHSEHGFRQAPYEEISAERYNELVRQTRPITRGLTGIETNDDDFGSAECPNGACPIK